MKKIIKLQLIAVLLSATMIAQGQPFVPVISSDSTTWDIAWKELFGNVMGRLYTVVSKDSTYYDLYFDFFGSNAEYVGKIREDANIGKIWYTPPDYTDEFLIMDLSLTIGDTFELPVSNTTISIEVVDVYHIDQRKYLEFDYPTQWDEPLRFIEGVGRNIAMFNFWFGDFTYVACKYNDGELFYVNSNPSFLGCSLSTSSIGESFQEDMSVFPNPVKSCVQFEVPCRTASSRRESSRFEVGELHLFDVFGRQVARKDITSEQTVLDVSVLPGGVYFYRVALGEVFYSGKIIIQK